MPVGLLQGSLAVRLESTAAGDTPLPAGQLGFLIGQPSNSLAVVELGSQLTIATLDAEGEVIESSSSIVPLRLDLLGVNLIGDREGVLSFHATQPYKAARLSFASGLASVLSQLTVYSACAAVQTEP